jgi:hypothetical protein
MGCTGATAYADYGQRPLCARYRCRAIAANRVAEIVRVTERARYSEIARVFARWRSSGRISWLGTAPYLAEPPYLNMSAILLAGRFVAFTSSIPVRTGSGEVAEHPIYRLDIKSGRRLKVGGGPNITDLVVTASGVVAWIEGSVGPGGRVVYEVRVGKPPSRFGVLLASATTIDPHSLAAIPGHLYWTEADQPREVRIE